MLSFQKPEWIHVEYNHAIWTAIQYYGDAELRMRGEKRKRLTGDRGSSVGVDELHHGGQELGGEGEGEGGSTFTRLSPSHQQHTPEVVCISDKQTKRTRGKESSQHQLISSSKASHSHYMCHILVRRL